VYRFYKPFQVYGTTIKALIEGEFGDGINDLLSFVRTPRVRHTARTDDRSNSPMTDRKHAIAATAEQAPAAALTQQRAVAVCGAIFGLFLIYGVGFAHPEAIHNAAHDSRHSFAFPCH
jgi:cobalt transporter subunit CbtB